MCSCALEFDHRNGVVRDISAGDVAKMIVGSKDDDLTRSGKVRQCLEDAASAHIIGGHEYIVENYRQVYTAFPLQFQGGQTQRQIELVACSIAHGLDRKNCAAGPFRGNHGGLI